MQFLTFSSRFFLFCLVFLPFSMVVAKSTTIQITTFDGQQIAAELVSKSILFKDKAGEVQTFPYDKINTISLVTQRLNADLKHQLLQDLDIEMILIPEGEFIMGDINGTGYDDEKPVHKVTLKAFLIQETEVSMKQYLAYLEATNRRVPEHIANSPTDDLPVTGVNWNDANRYAQWLSNETGLIFSLPSEAQWEYSARAGGMSDYAWGDSIGNNNAVCDGCGSRWDSLSTAPVGSFNANFYGLKDMHGNVWEWTKDCWHDNYTNAPTDGSAWTEGKCRKKALRGGSWTNEKENLRASTRFRGFSIKRDQDIGFRIVQIIKEDKE